MSFWLKSYGLFVNRGLQITVKVLNYADEKRKWKAVIPISSLRLVISVPDVVVGASNTSRFLTEYESSG